MNRKGVDVAAGVSSLGNTKFGASTSASASVYQVFLSFCGKDTRKGFTDFLYTYLVHANIQTFRDNDKLQVGQEIGPELLKAIKESKISIPIFSQNYAASKWCLLELEKIVECHKNGGQKIYPIFYDVDPSDVRNQRGSYELAFSLHEKEFDEGTVQRWRHALKVVGELKGFELKKETDGHEGEFVKLVVEKVLKELKNYTQVPQNMVGMDKHIEELMGLLEVDSNDVRILGIHGMGGLGKTTISRVIFNEMCKNFDGQCFLENVSEKSKHNDGIAEMQKQFICSIQKRGVSSVSNGRSSIKEAVCCKKLLLVLDDIDEYFQVEMLMGESSWYGAQSRIILTTRDKAVLDETKSKSDYSSVVYRSYSPKLMDNSDSLQLFSKHAFKMDSPIEEFSALSKDVVSIAAGLPLVLVVLGSTFFPLTKDKGLWEDKLKQLQKIPRKKVLEKLKFSFEALEYTEKQIFLDIACFFIGHHNTRPTYMWEECGFCPKVGISDLVSRSLITIDDNNKFRMHNELRDLGKQIVSEEGLQLPGKRSRLWCPDKTMRVLETQQGTGCVNALFLGFPTAVRAQQFHYLPNLRYLCMQYLMNVDGEFKDLLPNLRWLECSGVWGKFSLRNLNMKKLVVLNLSHNNGLTNDWEDWRQLKMANNLKVLDLSHCGGFKTLPNLSNLTNIVELKLSFCSKLVVIQGLQKLEFLQVLEINGCLSLSTLQNISSLKELKVFNADDCQKLSQIEGLGGLISLEHLDLRGCDSLKEVLEDLSNLNNLQVLKGAPGMDLTDFSNFKKLKQLEIYKSNRIEIHNLDGLEALEDLEISFCSSMVRLPKLRYLKRLRTLTICDCERLIEIVDLSELKSLERLSINGCNSVKVLPDLSLLQKLESLDVCGCAELSEIRGIEEFKCLTGLYIIDCHGLGHLLDFDLPTVRIHTAL